MLRSGLIQFPGESKINAHYFCDFIEILALDASGDVVSVTDVVNKILEDDDLAIDSDIEQGTSEYSSKIDRLSSEVESWFSLLAERSLLFGKNYPYTISDQSIRLRCTLSRDKLIYLFFLLASNLNFIESGKRKFLTTGFENLCCIAFKRYLPVISQVFVFGKSSATDSRYTGSKNEKIKKLASDLGLDYVEGKGEFSPKDHGDHGADIVAWTPFHSDVSKDRMDIYLGQCATGKKWLAKQSEVNKLNNKIHGIDRARSVLFIPYDIRNYSGFLFHGHELTVDLLVDRYRLCKLLTHLNTNWIDAYREIKMILEEIRSLPAYLSSRY
ncbi:MULTISPECIES: hypothetical protein [Thalassolituus]|uniref:hypothetical protein n=1 Tax=Thalassolituus TaxID=187492 RepID=UPI000C5006C8|nr:MULTISPECIES: hypothetical protein [Thalassolituus]MAX86741.1 hypothetical protein [Oceanospirillaceae bacterium]|tara:strand:- start:5336 stop:6316 length:981 start_codon:yes stop_codon:yes gene_type:complete